MTRVTQEIVIVYWGEDEKPETVVVSNGSHTFYALKKLNKEAVAELLNAEQIVK
jgi:hypothetical protein